MVIFLDELTCLSPCPIATTRRVHARDVEPGDVVMLGGEARRVRTVSRALDSTLDWVFKDGGAANRHPYVRVTIVGHSAPPFTA